MACLYALALSPPALTISRGASGTAQVTLTGINGFAGTINLSCTVGTALSRTTCSVSGGTGSTQTVTVSTASFGITAPELPNSSLRIMLFVLWLTAGCVWLIARIQNGHWRWAPALAFGCLLIAFVGCGGSGANNSGSTTSTEPTTASVTLQGTSDNTSHSTQLSATTNSTNTR
jgi:hypothetical protein